MASSGKPAEAPSAPGTEDAAKVVGIYTAPAAGAPMEQQGSVVVMPGVGIVGDRYALGTGTWSAPRWHDKELTLFEAEVAEEFGIEPYAVRRNIVLRGIKLYGLLGVRFRIGEVLLAGVRPCDPCGYIEKLNQRPGLREALTRGRGGLRTKVLEGGRIRLGDTLEVVGLHEE